jgi:hypothetical protein
MNLKRVPVRLDEPTERPLIPGLRTSQKETLIHVVTLIAHHRSPRQTAARTQTHRTITKAKESQTAIEERDSASAGGVGSQQRIRSS